MPLVYSANRRILFLSMCMFYLHFLYYSNYSIDRNWSVCAENTFRDNHGYLQPGHLQHMFILYGILRLWCKDGQHSDISTMRRPNSVTFCTHKAFNSWNLSNMGHTYNRLPIIGNGIKNGRIFSPSWFIQKCYELNLEILGKLVGKKKRKDFKLSFNSKLWECAGQT